MDWCCVPSRLRAAPRGIAPHATEPGGAEVGDAVAAGDVKRKHIGRGKNGTGHSPVGASRAVVRRVSIGVRGAALWSHLRNGVGGSSGQDQSQPTRTSTIFDKRSTASVTAMRVAAATGEVNELRDRVQAVFDRIVGGDCADNVSADLVAEALRELLGDISREDLASEADEFARKQVGRGDSFTVDQVAAYYRRFEPWAQERKLLSEHRIRLETSSLVLTGGGDGVVLAACQHCASLAAITIRHGRLRNSTLSTLAQSMRARLTDLDLTGTVGFDDLGLKAFAAYCGELRSLRVAECKVTDDGLIPIVQSCRKLRELVVTHCDAIYDSLQVVHADCCVTREAQLASKDAE